MAYAVAVLCVLRWPHKGSVVLTPLHCMPAGVVGTIIGDGVAQFTSRSSRSPNTPVYDVARASRLCAYAAVIGTPIGHYWFHFLDKVRICCVNTRQALAAG